MAFAMTANAQVKTDTLHVADTLTVQKKFSKGKATYDKTFHLMPEIKLGSCYGVAGIGANIVLERDFHKNLAWDVVSVDFSVPFKFNASNIGVKTGIRAFTNRFSKDRMRGFTSVAAGYECNIFDKLVRWEEGFPIIKKKPHHGLGISWGIGLQFIDRISVGYALEYSTGIKYTSHYGRVGYRF